MLTTVECGFSRTLIRPHVFVLQLIATALVCQFAAMAGTVRDTVLVCPAGGSCTILDQSFTGSATGSASNAIGSVQGFADATNGTLRASSSYDFPTGATVAGQVNGNAQFFGSFTVTGTGLSGNAFIQPKLTVHGTSTGTADAVAAFFHNANQSCSASQPNDFCQSFTVANAPNGIDILFSPVQITFGQSFSFEMDLDAESFFSAGSVSGSSTFDHTAFLTGLNLFTDSSLTNPIASNLLTFSSSDGIVYTTNGIVPEPESMALILGGLAALAGIVRKRRPSQVC
jgi:hypothetical protein